MPDITNTQHYNTACAALQALVHVHNHPVHYVHLWHYKPLVPQALQQALKNSCEANIATMVAQTLLLTDATTFSNNIK